MADIHLWRIPLAAPAGASADAGLLSPDERDRVARFLVPHAARRFTAARAATRRILGAIRGEPPASLVFTYGPAGKPALAGGPHFNLSHTGDLALLAIGPTELGVDVEAVRPTDPGVARLVFTPAERAWLDTLDAQARQCAFYRGWTRKEAAIKARGGSLADVLALEALPVPSVSGLTILDLDLGPEHAAAVAAPGEWVTVWQTM